jgi:hypothetical protein
MGACGNKQNVAAVAQPAGKTAEEPTAAQHETSVEAFASTDAVPEGSVMQNDTLATVTVDEPTDGAEKRGDGDVSRSVPAEEASPVVTGEMPAVATVEVSPVEATEEVSPVEATEEVSPAEATAEVSPAVVTEKVSPVVATDDEAAKMHSALAVDVEPAGSEMDAAASVSTAASAEEIIKPLGEAKLPVESKDFERMIEDIETLPVSQSWWRCM